ncbi:sensor histidine kinase [Marinicella meishanensis]|uniref:sensor histidine kinase n=1 Tax=Marinicella meishanensis TaxID=2873263 RepID=UPI001CBBF460|nr:HAMP domain-containing sensor histidine kinase [Marinicella sp. NBU2979]
MMVLIAWVLITLIWRLQQSWQTQQQTVQQVLTDYAAMAGEQFNRSIKGQLGYLAMYDLSQQWVTPNEPSELIAQYLDQPQDAMTEARWRVRSGIQAIAIHDQQLDTTTPISHPSLGAMKCAPAWDQLNLESGFGAHHLSQPQLSFCAWIKANDRHIALVQFSPDFVTEALHFLVEQRPLLPAVLSNNQALPGLQLALRHPSGSTLWQSAGTDQAAAAATTVIGDDYGGLFAEYTTHTAITEPLAEQLLDDGLPQTELTPLLILIMVAVGAMVWMYWLYRSAVQLNTEKVLFIARASHELKTPLTQIRLYTESLLLARLPAPEQQQHALQVINQESIRLGQLVDNILQLNQLHRGTTKPQVQTIHLAAFIQQLLELQRILWQDRAILTELDIPTDLVLISDPDQLKQVLLNLLDNAVKFGPPAQTLRLEAAQTELLTTLKLTDQGPGIPPQQVKLVLQNHQRLDRDERRGINGNGLGLGIAQQLLKRLGGQLSFAHPATGLTVIMQLPNKPPRQEDKEVS